MNLSNQTTPWLVASLLAAASVFGGQQNHCNAKKGEPNCPPNNCNVKTAEPNCPPACQPLEPICQPQMCKPAKCGRVQEPQHPIIAAYNAPAEINVGFQGEWDFFITGSVLYWQISQDDMRVATKDSLTIPGVGSTNFHGKTVDMDFDFHPGFKLALGMNFRNDDWVGYVEYTRMRGENDTSESISQNRPGLYNTWGDLFPYINDDSGAFFVQYGGPGFVFDSLSAEFSCNQDFIDPQLERVYYVGKSLIFHSVFGGRIALISEDMHARYSYNGSLTPAPGAEITNKFALPGSLKSVNRSNSWAVGPRFGLEMDWMVSRGMRLFGSAFADVLYTHYKVQTKTELVPSISVGDFVAGNAVRITNRDEFGTLRAHVDLEAGLGWGTYLDYNSWHIDFAASYGFQVFFNQNVLRLPTYSPSNLYVQGLTFTTRLDY